MTFTGRLLPFAYDSASLRGRAPAFTTMTPRRREASAAGLSTPWAALPTRSRLASRTGKATKMSAQNQTPRIQGDIVEARLRRAKQPRTAIAGPYGHPLHATVVPIPIGAWTASIVFDILALCGVEPD